MNELSLYSTKPSSTFTQRLRDEEPTCGVSQVRNIGQGERICSMVGGAILVLGGLPRGKILRTLIGGALLYRGITGHCHCYQALGLDTSDHPDHTAVPAQQGIKVEHSITINRPADELFAFWRSVENLPQVMRHLETVEEVDRQRSRWSAKGPLGKIVAWEAEIINERESELIAWRSLPGGDIETAGSVHFRQLENDRGTAVVVSMKYNPPAGKLGATVASLLGSGLARELEDDMRRFKSHMETGEVPTTEGQPSGE